jgi:Sec-independent protein translocase protein TatA
MKTIPKKLLLLALCVLNLSAFAQRIQEHTVYFENIDGFSGYVNFTTKYAGLATRVHAYNKVLVLTRYNTSHENLEVLAQAGYDLRGGSSSKITPPKYGYDVEGRTYMVSPSVHKALDKSKFHLTDSGSDFSTPNFDDDAKKQAKWFRESKNRSYWETYGGMDDEKVTALYIPEVKNEIDRILREHKKEAEEKEKAEKEKSSTKSTSVATLKTKKAKEKSKAKEKAPEKTKTLGDYAFEARVKGDQALASGNYRAAEKHYKDAKAMGAYIDDKKMRKAQAGSMASSMAQVFSYIPSEDETLSALTLSYYKHSDYWQNVSLAWTPETYWGDFFIQWGFNLNYTKGAAWINQRAPKIGLDKIYYETEQTKTFTSDIRANLAADEILFSKRNDTYTDYAIYKYQDFESLGGGLEFGFGYRIPIAQDGGIGLPLGGVGLLNLSSYSSNLGYRFFTGIDFSRLFLRLSYLTVNTTRYNFKYDQLSRLKGTKSNSFDDLDKLGSIKKNFSTVQFSIGIYL